MKRKTIHLIGEKRHELAKLLRAYGMDVDITVEPSATLKRGTDVGRETLKRGDVVLGVETYTVIE